MLLGRVGQCCLSGSCRRASHLRARRHGVLHVLLVSAVGSFVVHAIEGRACRGLRVVKVMSGDFIKSCAFVGENFCRYLYTESQRSRKRPPRRQRKRHSASPSVFWRPTEREAPFYPRLHLFCESDRKMPGIYTPKRWKR